MRICTSLVQDFEGEVVRPTEEEVRGERAIFVDCDVAVWVVSDSLSIMWEVEAHNVRTYWARCGGFSAGLRIGATLRKCWAE